MNDYDFISNRVQALIFEQSNHLTKNLNNSTIDHHFTFLVFSIATHALNH